MKSIHYCSNILLLLLFFSINNTLHSQAVNWQWAHSMGGQGNEYCNDIIVDSSGNIYTIGVFGGTVAFDSINATNTLTSAGIWDIFICKMDENGALIWAKAFGGTKNDEGNSIAIDNNGNIYATGYFNDTADFDPSSGIFNLTSIHGQDMFVLKLDNFGNFLWVKQLGGLNDNFGKNIALDGLNNIYTTGSFLGTVDFDPGAGVFNLTASHINTFICRLDSLGNFVWAKQFTGSSSNYVCSLALDDSAYVYTTGDFLDDVDFNPGPGIYKLIALNSYDMFLSKLDSSGNFAWAKRIGGYDSNAGLSIAFDPSGNVYTTGGFQGNVDFNPGPLQFVIASKGLLDIFILKLTRSGKFVWAKNLGGVKDNLGLDIAIDPITLKIYSTGYYIGLTDFDPGPGSNILSTGGTNACNAFVSVLDTAGNYVAVKNSIGTAGEVGERIAISNSGEAYISGYFGSPTFKFDSIVLTNANSTGTTDDFFLAKLSCKNSKTISRKACNSYTSPSGKYTWTNSGTYRDTIPNNFGCDSVIKIHLTISTINTSLYMTLTKCDQCLSPSGKYIWTNSGIYMDTIPNAGGCDSVITIALTIKYSTSSSITDTACISYISPSGLYTWTTSGLFHDTLVNADGCDSLISVNLTINNSNVTVTITACFSYTSPSGNYTWTTSGNYYDVIPTAFGCDSVILFHLTINAGDVTVSQNGLTLAANATGVSYQWLDCDNGFAPLNGDTNRIFTASADGNYAVSITQNGCTDTSACYTITGVGISEISSGNNFEIFPNPASSDFTVIFKNQNKKSELTIRDLTGKLIYAITVTDKRNIKVNTKDYEEGIYFVKIQTQDFVETKKIIVLK